MSGFIEVTGVANGGKICISVERIFAFTEDGDGTYIETYQDRMRHSWGYAVKESYDEVVAKIKEATAR